jgi:hypothetical protein
VLAGAIVFTALAAMPARADGGTGGTGFNGNTAVNGNGD